jgi:hypothetical protein
MITKDLFEEHVRNDERQLNTLTAEVNHHRADLGKVFDEIKDVRKDMNAGQQALLSAINNLRQ